MTLTLEQLVGAGYDVQPAPVDDWREFDELDPVPGYFHFDWLSSRHPDLYHRFALSTDGLMDELEKLVDLTGLAVADIGAGTGRSTMAAARKAKTVMAVDPFESVISYGKDVASRAGMRNVGYVRGNTARLPLADDSFDACISSWAVVDYREAFRVLRPDGYLIQLGAAPGALCGELTPMLASMFPDIITEVAPGGQLDAACPASDSVIPDAEWNGLPVSAPTILHDFTYVADYADYCEAAAILGRLYGPVVRQYMLDRRQATLSWRLRIAVARVNKSAETPALKGDHQ